MSPDRSQLLKTANAFISAYNKWTISDILSIRSPTCIHRVIPGKRPDRNNAEFGAFFESILPSLRDFRVHEVAASPFIVDVEARKVVMHLTSTGDSDIGPYTNEYIFWLTISEDGEKVDEIVEFLDSFYTASFLQRLAEQTGQKWE